MSDIRYNLLDDRYVIIAPERLHRPEYMAWSKEEEEKKICPFCEGNEDMTPPEVYAIREESSFSDEKGWKTRVVPNLYKAVQIEAANTSRSEGIYEAFEGFGAHEVIIDTPKHLKTMREWDRETFVNWLITLQKRVTDLKRDHRIVFISLFKNQGSNAGATQKHSHTQLIGLPVVPTEIIHKYERLHRHYHTTGRALVEDIISQEQRDTKRIVMENDDFIAFCPYASDYPFEVMVVSKENLGGIERMGSQHFQNLALLLKELMLRMYRELGDFDFNISISVPPLQKVFQTESFFDDMEKTSRFSLHITPRIYRHGGFEISTGTMINPVSPEESALLLRESNDGDF